MYDNKACTLNSIKKKVKKKKLKKFKKKIILSGSVFHNDSHVYKSYIMPKSICYNPCVNCTRIIPCTDVSHKTAYTNKLYGNKEPGLQRAYIKATFLT